MFERKEKIEKNKKYIISHDYIRKVFNSKTSYKNIKSKNSNSDFKKIENPHKINISNDQPLVLFHKPNSGKDKKIENTIKKDLIENKGYLSDGSCKKKLLKYFSYHDTNQNNSKKKVYSSYNKNNDEKKEIQNLFNSKRDSFNNGLNSRTIQKDYSNSIKKINKRPKIKHKDMKENKNKLFNSVNLNDIKKKNLLIKKLTDKKFIKNLMGNLKTNINTQSTKKDNDFQRKKEYLKQNNISYENESIIDNKNNKLIKNDKTKELKDIIINNKRFINPTKSEDFKINNEEKDSIKNKKYNKGFKNKVNQFEFIHKIRKEFRILQKSKNKEKKIN